MKPGAISLRGLWLLVSAVAALSACSKDAGQLFESAKQREAKGDRVGAIIELKSAIQKDSENAAMRFMLGRLYNEAFDEVSAEKELRKARELGLVEGGRVNVELARALRAQAKFKELVNDIEPAAAFEPEQLAILHALRGRAQLSLDDSEGAKKSFEQAREVAPEAPDVLVFDAQMKATHKDLDGALRVIDDVVKRVPNRYDVWIFKAGLHEQKRQIKFALEAYDKVLSIHPTNLRALLSRSTYLIALGQLDAAEKDVATMLKAYKRSPLVWNQQGQLQIRQGRYKEAAESAQQAVKLNPNFPQAQLTLGIAYQGMGSLRQAEQVLTKYVAAYPKDLFARSVLADVLGKSGDPTRALETLAPVLSAGVNDPRVLAVAADANVQLGNYDAAAKFYEKAVGGNPQNSELQLRQALGLIAGGKSDLGVKALEGSVATAKNSTFAKQVLILALLSRGELDKAMAEIDDLERDKGSAALASNLRGILLLRKGENGAARQAFEKALDLQPSMFAAADNLVRLDLQAGRPNEARTRYEKVLKADPKNLRALIASGDLELRLRNLKQAKEIYLRAAETHPSALEPRIQLARLYVAEEDIQRAKTMGDEVVAMNPGHPLALILKAEIEMLAGNQNSAIQALSSLVSAYPKSADAHFRLGNAQRVANRMKDAEANYRKALDLEPGDAPVQVALISLLVHQKRNAEAHRLARNTQATFPRLPLGSLLEGEIFEAEGNHKEAVALFKKALKLRNSPEIASKVYKATVAMGDPRRALVELEEYAKTRPKDVETLRLLAYASTENSDHQRAAQHYKTIIELVPTDIRAMNGLAWSYFKIGDKQARSTAEAATKLNPHEPLATDTLGWILVHEGDVARGLELIKRAAAVLPKHPEIRYHLAVALLKSGDKAAARKELTDALALSSSFPESQEAKALLASLR